MRNRPKVIEMERLESLNKERSQLPEVRLREKEIQELYRLFRSYGISIPMRSLRFLQKKSDDPYSVDMRIFMRNTGYACCDNTIDAIWNAYLNWTATRMTIEEFLKFEAAESLKIKTENTEDTGDDDHGSDK